MLGYLRFSEAWKRVTFSGMENQPDRKSLLDAYRVPGFRARARVAGGDLRVFVARRRWRKSMRTKGDDKVTVTVNLANRSQLIKGKGLAVETPRAFGYRMDTAKL